MLEEQRRAVGVKESLTETALQTIGALYVVGGMLVAVFCILIGVSEEQPVLLALGVAFLAGGFLMGMTFFIAQLMLRYLRRIMNAVEQGYRMN